MTGAFGLPITAKFSAVRLKWFNQSGSGVAVGGNGVSVGVAVKMGVGGITVCVTVGVWVEARTIASIAVMVGMGAMVGAGGAAWHAVRVSINKITLCCKMNLNGNDIIL